MTLTKVIIDEIALPGRPSPMSASLATALSINYKITQISQIKLHTGY
jgi:hypothetical protein